MPNPPRQHTSPTVPKYRRQAKARGTDLAFIQVRGRRIYLGPYNSPQSHEAYRRHVARLLQEGPTAPAHLTETTPTVAVLIDAYSRHAARYYVKPDGTPTSMQARVKIALRQLFRLYGSTPAADFGPNDLRLIRGTWIEKGLSRKTVKDYTHEIKRLFKWSVSHELAPPSVYHALQTVDGLRRGRSGAKETGRVLPVPEPDIAAIEPFVSPQVWAMVQIQRLTGARSGELCRLRPIDIDTSGDVWVACLDDHKTAHHGHAREILIGPRGQV